MIVGGRVEYLLTLPLGTQNPGRAQQAQMVAHQRRRQACPRRDIRYADGRGQTGQNHTQPARIAKNAKHLGKLNSLIIGDWGGGH